MRRFLFILLFVLILPMLSLTNLKFKDCQYLTIADSGFDSDYGDYDGGSWGGGSSWGDDGYGSSYSNSSGGSLDSSFLPLVIFLGVGAAVVVGISRHYIDLQQRRKAVEQRINMVLLNHHNLKPGDGKGLELIQSAYANYVDIQKAWMNRDLSSVRHLLTDEIYNMYQMQIQTLIEDNQVNVMTNFELVCGKLEYKRAKDSIETIKVILCVNCKDYIEDVSTHKVINGDKNATITYIYELTFIKDVDSNKTINCPSCGAKVKKQMSASCPYCNNSLLSTSANITMSNKLILNQFKRK